MYLFSSFFMGKDGTRFSQMTSTRMAFPDGEVENMFSQMVNGRQLPTSSETVS